MCRLLSGFTTLLRALLGAGGLIFLLGPLLQPDLFGSPYLGLTGSGLVIGLIVHAALRPGLSADEPGKQSKKPNSGTSAEQYPDHGWTSHDAESSYRDLLERQSNLVLKRDSRGLLTYVNQAFCDAFGVTVQKVIGTAFSPTVIEEENDNSETSYAVHRVRRFTQRLETAAGPRWFAWEECSSPGGPGGGAEILLVGRDITEERNTAGMLAQARQHAEAESLAKSRFLAAFSLEIRQHFEIIIGMSDRMRFELPPEQESQARQIREAGRSVLDLVDQVIDLSRLESGAAQAGAAAFDLETCLQTAVERLACVAYDKGLELGWTIDGAVPRTMAGDEERVRRLLLNLVSYAIDSTGHGVLVRATMGPARGDRQSISIRLEGAGWPEQAESIPRLDLSRRYARVMGGTLILEPAPGDAPAISLELPLPIGGAAPAMREGERGAFPTRVLICSSLQIEAQVLVAELRAAGAHVTTVCSNDTESAIEAAAGEGDGFDIVIVDSATSPEVAAVLLACAKEKSTRGRVRGCVLTTARQIQQLDPFRAAGFEDHLVRPVSRSSLRTLLGMQEGAGKKVAQATPLQPPCRDVGTRFVGRRILIAEDNAINARLIQCMVHQAGCTSLLVESGRTAVDVLRGSLEGKGPSIDLVLMDVHMPDVDGLAAAREIRRLADDLPGGSELGRRFPPLIAITAGAFAEDRQRCLDAGMDDYLAKPFSWPEFQALLDRWLAPGPDADSGREANIHAA